MFLGLTLDELMEVVRTCDSIEIEVCTPDYLQAFIVKRLEPRFSQLAAQVLDFSTEQVSALCEYIRETHFLIRP